MHVTYSYLFYRDNITLEKGEEDSTPFIVYVS